MNEVTLPDGTKLVQLDILEKASLEKEIADLFEKYQAVMIPVLVKDLSSISAGVNIYKKIMVSPFNGESDDKTKENPDTKTEEGS